MLAANKATLLRLHNEGEYPTVYTWKPERDIWVNYGQSTRRNLYSVAGIGAKGVAFGVYRTGDITLHDALQYKDDHYFLTNMEQKEPAAAEISAALVDVTRCKVKKLVDTGKDALNRPIKEDRYVLDFPAVLTEKYVKWGMEEPQAVREVQYVLITPKPIILLTGDIVEIGADTYHITACHMLERYKNEYEAILRRDV